MAAALALGSLKNTKGCLQSSWKCTRVPRALCTVHVPNLELTPGAWASGHNSKKITDTNVALKLMSCFGEMLAKQASRNHLHAGFTFCKEACLRFFSQNQDWADHHLENYMRGPQENINCAVQENECMTNCDPPQPVLPPRETAAQHNCTQHLGNAVSREQVTKRQLLALGPASTNYDSHQAVLCAGPSMLQKCPY